MMKKFVLGTFLSISLLSVAAIPAMAEVDHLTPEKNPAKPSHRANAQSDVLSGRALPARTIDTLNMLGDPDHTQIYEFTFTNVSGTGIDSKKFNSLGGTIEIDSFAERSSGQDGNYNITLYKKGAIFNKNLGTRTYKHSYQGTWGSATWTGDGTGEYFFWIGSEVYQQLISGKGVVYDVR